MNYKELLEFQKFRDFLPTKNGIKTFELKGHDNLGSGNMRIVIDASPERLASVTYYDGIGNQIYPPHSMNIQNIVCIRISVRWQNLSGIKIIIFLKTVRLK